MNTKSILPIFMICARSDELLECTFNSYNRYVYDSFSTPIIFFNASESEVENERVRTKLKELFGDKTYILHENKIVHNYKNVQLASLDCLRFAEQYAREKVSWWRRLYRWLTGNKRVDYKYDGILFSEDDVTFSNLLAEKLKGLDLTGKEGFVTLYQPENGYRLHKNGEIDASVFYGTQSLIFPIDSLKIVCYDSTCQDATEGYDRVWVKLLASKGRMPYALDASYIQHNQTSSLLSGHSRTHSSAVFRFDLDAL